MDKNLEELRRKCDICNIITKTTKDDTALFGDWLKGANLNVHYFCLLMATHLPQKGKDRSGLLGFLINDIRKEVKAAATRICCYCNKTCASIQCQKCYEYFHLVCGEREGCLFHFFGTFSAYCDRCVPLTQYQIEFQQKKLSHPFRCYICMDLMGTYEPVTWIYANCCGNGFVHKVCMQLYALNAGYYLRCLWCGSNDFRDHVRRQGVFVPDRDAIWEDGGFRDLHRGHKYCNINKCLCPQGRKYNSKKWTLTNCIFCGSFGAHNPICITGDIKTKTTIEDFSCSTCTEKSVSISENTLNSSKTNLENSVYMQKETVENKSKILNEKTDTEQTSKCFEEPSTSSKQKTVHTGPIITYNEEDFILEVLKFKKRPAEEQRNLQFNTYWEMEEDKEGDVNCTEIVTTFGESINEDEDNKDDEDETKGFKEEDVNLINKSKVVWRSKDTGIFKVIDVLIDKYNIE